MSFLIQRSPDQCLFAAPRSLSQLITSFIGSQCQGIRPAPLFPCSNYSLSKWLFSFEKRRLLLPFLLKLQYFLKELTIIFVSRIQFSLCCPFPGSRNFITFGPKWTRTIDLSVVSLFGPCGGDYYSLTPFCKAGASLRAVPHIFEGPFSGPSKSNNIYSACICHLFQMADHLRCSSICLTP